MLYVYNQNQDHTTDTLTLKNNNMRLFEKDMHKLALLFMEQFPTLDEMSLDDFLFEYNSVLTDEQNELGHHILEMFNYVK